MPPYRLAGALAVCRHDFAVAALLLRIDHVAANRERRPAWADRAAPQLNWWRCRPVSADMHAANDAVAFWTAKAWPLSRRRVDRRGAAAVTDSAAFGAVAASAGCGVGAAGAAGELGAGAAADIAGAGAGVTSGLTGSSRDDSARSFSSAVLFQRHVSSAMPPPVMPSVRKSVHAPHASTTAATISAHACRAGQGSAGGRPGDESDAQRRYRVNGEHHPHHPGGNRPVDQARRRDKANRQEREYADALRPRRAAEAKPPHNNGKCAGDATDDADHRAVGPHERQEVACHQHHQSDRDSWPEAEAGTAGVGRRIRCVGHVSHGCRQSTTLDVEGLRLVPRVADELRCTRPDNIRVILVPLECST